MIKEKPGYITHEEQAITIATLRDQVTKWQAASIKDSESCCLLLTENQELKIKIESMEADNQINVLAGYALRVKDLAEIERLKAEVALRKHDIERLKAELKEVK